MPLSEATRLIAHPLSGTPLSGVVGVVGDTAFGVADLLRFDCADVLCGHHFVCSQAILLLATETAEHTKNRTVRCKIDISVARFKAEAGLVASGRHQQKPEPKLSFPGFIHFLVRKIGKFCVCYALKLRYR